MKITQIGTKKFFSDKRDNSEKNLMTGIFFGFAATFFFFCTKTHVNKNSCDVINSKTNGQSKLWLDRTTQMFLTGFETGSGTGSRTGPDWFGRDKNLWMRRRSCRVTSFPVPVSPSKILRTHSQKFPHETRGTRFVWGLRTIRQNRTWLHRNRKWPF